MKVEELPEPRTMKQCIDAKCQAQARLRTIDAEIREWRKIRKEWNKRLGVCLRKMYLLQNSSD